MTPGLSVDDSPRLVASDQQGQDLPARGSLFLDRRLHRSRNRRGGTVSRGTLEALHRRFVAPRNAANPYGDFLIVIEGASQDKDRKENAAWTLVAGFEVQPADVVLKAETKWSSK